MSEDLLTRIQRETHERLRELRGAVDEHDRLQGELRVLDAAPEPAAEVASPAALDTDAEPFVESEPSVTPATSVDPEPPANVVRLPARPRLSRTGMVSPKVARLMLAPRRPALERAGVARVGAGRVGSSAEEMVDEVDAEAEVYERAL